MNQGSENPKIPIVQRFDINTINQIKNICYTANLDVKFKDRRDKEESFGNE